MKEKDMLTFSKVLKQYRIENKNSQRQMIEIIRSIDDTFIHLDAITYSRWENGHTSPSIIKQCKILRVLEKYNELIIIAKNSNFGKNKYQKIVNTRFSKHYQNTDSAYYTSVNEVFYKHEREISLETHQMIYNFQGEIYGNPPSFEEITKFQSMCHETHAYIYKNKNGDLIGHSIFFKVNWGVIKNHLNNIKCHVKGFIPDSEVIIFIASDYAAIKNVGYFKFKIYRDYLLHSKVNFFFVRTFHQQGITLFESLSPVIVTTPQAQKQGVAYLSKKYPWVGFAGNIDNFLITDISAFAEDNSQDAIFIKC